MKYGKESDVLYFKLSKGLVMESDEDKPGIIIEYGEEINAVKQSGTA